MDLNNRIAQWKQTPFDKKTQDQVGELEKSPIEAEDAFYKDLEFGTGGMRGVLGVGTNRINQYTLGKNSQGIADYLLTLFPNTKIRVVSPTIAVTKARNWQKFVQMYLLLMAFIAPCLVNSALHPSFPLLYGI